MVVLVGRNSRRNVKLRSLPIGAERYFWTEEVFNEAYVSKLHRRGFASIVRYWTKAKGSRLHRTKAALRHAAVVRKCVIENRPFLAGFFADEPTWRPRLIAWADKVLSTPRQSKA